MNARGYITREVPVFYEMSGAGPAGGESGINRIHRLASKDISSGFNMLHSQTSFHNQRKALGHSLPAPPSKRA